MNESVLDRPDHIIESELTPLPPRRVRFSGRAFVVCLATLFLFLAFATCGLATLGEAWRMQDLVKRGHVATATVTQIDYSTGQAPTTDAAKWNTANSGSVSSIIYKFASSDGATHIGRIPITPARSDAGMGPPTPFTMLPGTTLQVWYEVTGDRVISRPWSGDPGKRIGFLVVAGLAAICFGAYLAWRAFRWVSQSYNLVRTGFVAEATIITKDSRTEDAARFYVSVGYTSHDGVMRQKTIQCTSSQYQKFESGQTLTVIYPSMKPEEATLYALLPFGR
ncbi:MAG TPA: DUF3592 domain-containing protein [Capsulimonadaceae bacterium]